MKIAIVAPSPVPFGIGGAENLWRGLFEYLNQETSHQADLIKLPSKEHNFWDLIDSYRAFSLLDLRHFDLVLSTKYPAWMVSHPRHVCYMQHRLRGLADHYHLTGQPARFTSGLPLITKLQSYMRDHQGAREALPEFFGLLDELRGSPDLPQDALAFPGPFIREIVEFLDGIGLSRTNIHRYAAISAHVAKREGYFPKGVPVKVIHHPSSLKAFRTGGSDYLFTASRLDQVKRVALAVETMQHLPQDITLKIAGDGPDQGRLTAMAGDDPRISFLGFVPDHELENLYADALAVLFVPYDEDYGLITIEAMMSRKPVITCLDSGGPNEFVRDGETGFSVKPSSAALAEKIGYLHQHPAEARRMGQAGRAKAEGITWERTVSALLDEPVRRPASVVHRSRRPKITLASTFSVYPPGYGGPIRVYHLYKNLTRLFDVDLVTISYATDTPFEGEIAPGLREIRVPKSPKHQKRELELEGKVGVPIGDVAMPRLLRLTPEYMTALKRSVAQSQFVVACHPYMLPAIAEVCDLSQTFLIYEAQDVEYVLKQQVLPDNTIARSLLEDTRKVEADCCQLSRLIMVCAMSEAKSLSELYGVAAERMVEVPNGADLETVHFTDSKARKKAKWEAGLEHSFVAIFMGSRHPPNVAAADQLLALAKVLPDVRFLIMGDVCWALRQKALPKNLGLMGVVDEETRLTVLRLADVALNPMTMGSGTNLKMLEYMAAGIPVISTTMGARGLGIENGEHAVICPIEAFPEEIQRVRDDPGRVANQTKSARSLVERSFDWRVIAGKLEAELQDLLPPALRVAVSPNTTAKPARAPRERTEELAAILQGRLGKLDAAWERIEQIEGWSSKGAAELLMGCHAWQEFHGVSGHLAEIGCYKGRYTSCLALCLQEGETIYIDDIFELQELNISRSGKSCTESDVKWSIKLTGGDATRLRFLKKKSSELTTADIPSNIRLFHIDGGHSFSEQYEDLEYAAAHIMRPYGLLIVDDYENYEWLEVRQATNAFLARHEELVVLAFRDNKAIIGCREVSSEFESEIIPLLASQHRRAT